MVKFIHTADWQIGSSFTGKHPDLADQLREARLDTAEDVMNIAREEDADFVVIAGDLFENAFAERSLRVKVHDILTQDGNPPVYVVAGNHDPVQPGCVYHQSPFTRDHPTLHIPEEPTSYDLPNEDGVLLTAPLTEKTSRNDPTGRFPETDTDGIRIGVTHGQLRIEGQYNEDAHPIDLDAIENSDLNYLALGDWHTHFKHPDHPDRCRYSGTHEKGKFDDDAGILVVEIEDSDREPEIEYRETGQFRWETIDKDLTPEGALAQLRERLDKLDPGVTLLELHPKGTLEGQRVMEYEELLKNTRERFAHVELTDDELHEPVAVKSILNRMGSEELLNGALADLVRLKTMMDPDAGTEIPDVDSEPLAGETLRDILDDVRGTHESLNADDTEPTPEDIDRVVQELHAILERKDR